MKSESHEDRLANRTHIGVINVQKRIKLLYGEDYGMSIRSQKGKGTQIIIRLPIEADTEV